MIRSTNGHEPDRIIDRSLRDSAQIPPNVTQEGVISAGLFGASTERGAILPPYGTRAREWTLRRIYRMDEMFLVRGAFTGVAKMIASLPWEIKGGDETEDPTFGAMAQARGWRLRKNTGVEYFQEVFRQANFGGGWGQLITQLVNDFLRYDAGGYLEVIAPGDAYDSPRTAITGIAHLDPLRCYPTGDPRYPCVYYDRWGGMHVMNHARVIRMVDMPDGDEMIPGYGDSALARYIAIAMREVYSSRYINNRLDDQPPPGLTLIGGIMKSEWDIEQAKYRAQHSNDAMPVYGRRQFYFTPDPSVMPKVESYEFSSPPESFDARAYMDMDVDILALVLGVDRQELMPLMQGNMGSGAQSNILAQKSRGKTIGFLLQQLERTLNDLLPDEYTFEFKYRDSQEALEDAQKMQIISAAVASMGAALTPDEQRTLLSEEIEAVRDAIMNTVRANDVYNTPFTAEDNTAGAAPTVAPVQGGTPGGVPGQAAKPQVANAPQVNINDDVNDDITAKSVEKSYLDTETGFIRDVTDLLLSASTPNPYLDRRAFSVTMRSFLKNYGLQAYKDGMTQGGVTVDSLDAEDTIDYTGIFVDQSQYINGLADDVYKSKSINASNAGTRAYMWTKSLQAFADAGQMAANKNAMYEWVYGITEHCTDCLRLNGQVHRIHNWKKSGWLPRSNKLDCHGYNCKCRLVRTTQKARGRF